ncbi:MAG TPA: hypothetical protein PKJ33_01510 [Alphaproteobacteria bacterium]|nr:hypothetical protein [Alphaproteobacteria bacterium]
MSEGSYTSNAYKSVNHKDKDYTVVCANHAPNINVKSAKIIFCKEGTNIKIEENSSKTKIFYGLWFSQKSRIYNRNYKIFEYIVPKEENIDWDEQIKLISKQILNCKKPEKIANAKEKIDGIKNALEIIEEMKARKREKELKK